LKFFTLPTAKDLGRSAAVLGAIAGVIAMLALPSAALGADENTRESLLRLEETLGMRFEDGGLSRKELTPAIVVSLDPAFEQSRTWYPTAALATLARVFGSGGLRACEACMAPRLYVEEGRVEQVSTGVGAAEIVRLDENGRGGAAAARTAVWLDETPQGVSLRIIELGTSRIVLAENFDPSLAEAARTRGNFTMARELDRRTRGESLTHTFVDVAMYPGQHLSLDWLEQWGYTNANLSGLSISLFDPVLGIGAAYYRVVPNALNITVGGKVLMSLPTAVVRAFAEDVGEIIDPLLTAVFVARMPIARSNYAITLTASTNGRFGMGFSLMNTTLLPFLP
jgi:hypothetical protein